MYIGEKSPGRGYIISTSRPPLINISPKEWGNKYVVDWRDIDTGIVSHILQEIGERVSAYNGTESRLDISTHLYNHVFNDFMVEIWRRAQPDTVKEIEENLPYETKVHKGSGFFHGQRFIEGTNNKNIKGF